MYSQMNLFGDDLSEEKSLKYETIEEAEQVAIDRIRLASQFSEHYYQAPIMITYSGGKDSDVLLRLAQKSGVTYEVIHAITTVDAPETNRHVNEVFKRERERRALHKAHSDLQRRADEHVETDRDKAYAPDTSSPLLLCSPERNLFIKQTGMPGCAKSRKL